MSCGIHSGCKMFISVHQCMRNTFNVNKEILISRRFNTLKKALRPVPLIRFSQCYIKDITIRHEKGGSNVFLQKHLFVPMACKLYSNGKPHIEDEPQIEKKAPRQTTYQRFKTMFKEYWYVLIPVHIVTSCLWFGGFYYMATSGVDIPSLLEKLGAPESWIERLRHTKAGNVVLAYTLYKVMTPFRYTVTIGGSTLAIQHLKRWGWIKPVPNSVQLKQMYEGQRDAFRDLRAGYQDKMQVTKNEFLKTKDGVKKQLEVAKEEFHKSMSEMRRDFKDGVKGGAEEWKIISKAYIREPKLTAKIKDKQND